MQSEELVRWALSCGADANRLHNWGVSPLSMAVQNQSPSMIDMSFKKGGDLRHQLVLFFAVHRTEEDCLAILSKLVAFGANIDGRCYEDEPDLRAKSSVLENGTPLHTAAKSGFTHVVAFLLDNGADRNKLDTAGRTAFEIAASNGHEDICQMIETRYNT
jgi:ankyrin repeat protein